MSRCQCPPVTADGVTNNVHRSTILHAAPHQFLLLHQLHSCHDSDHACTGMISSASCLCVQPVQVEVDHVFQQTSTQETIFSSCIAESIDGILQVGVSLQLAMNRSPVFVNAPPTTDANCIESSAGKRCLCTCVWRTIIWKNPHSGRARACHLLCSWHRAPGGRSNPIPSSNCTQGQVSAASDAVW